MEDGEIQFRRKPYNNVNYYYYKDGFISFHFFAFPSMMIEVAYKYKLSMEAIGIKFQK